MARYENAVKSWSGVKDLPTLKQLADRGVLVSWDDAKSLSKDLADHDMIALIEYFADLFSQRISNRLGAEIIAESLLLILAQQSDATIMTKFIEQLMSHHNRSTAARAFVEIAITAELSEESNLDEIASIAVATICEMGLEIYEFHKAYPGEFEDADKVLRHIATYLLSVSNLNNPCIRLSLFHYFGRTEYDHSYLSSFNKVVGRFGHTLLEHLFTLLFSKKTEGVAIQYIKDNLHYMFLGDNHSQRILHETFKFYMLKNPDRFSLFIHTFSGHVLEMESPRKAQIEKVFLQHLTSLLKIVSEVDHRSLGRDLMVAIVSFSSNDYSAELVEQILASSDIRSSFKKFLQKLYTSGNHQQVIDESVIFRSNKRGRKPSFTKVEYKGYQHQVSYLGSQDVAKAS